MTKINQEEVILNYLKMQTNYAIMLYGEYGIGKTHFYKNILIPKIKETSTTEDKSKKYIPIHISLFGIKSIEDIQTAIFTEIYPLLIKNKKLKLAANIGKTITRGVLNVVGAGNIDEYLNDLKEAQNDTISYGNLVLCFDDLDRKSTDFHINELLGFINMLVENQGAKIILIAHEKKLLENKEKNYVDFFEKVIGVKMHYIPNIQEVYSQIIELKYSSSNKLYYSFLETSKKKILHTIEANDNNFRNLMFFLEYFKDIYSGLTARFQESKDFKVAESEKLKAVLDFTLAIAFEYKKGSLNSKNFDDIKRKSPYTTTTIPLRILFDKEPTQEAEETYIESFSKRYFSESRYYYFNSIFEYITGICSFKIDVLVTELENYFEVKDGELLAQNKILKKLDYWGCINLTDKEYKDLTRKMLTFADEGKYDLVQYAQVFHYATRFNNLMGFKLDNLKTRIKKGVKKGIKNYKYKDHIQWHMSYGNEVEFKKDIDDIIKYCSEINDQVKDNDSQSEIEELYKLFEKDFDGFLEEISKRESKWKYMAFWNKLNANSVIRVINKLNNKQIWDFADYFRQRYLKGLSQDLCLEKDFVISLRQDIDKAKVKRSKKTLRNESLNYLSEVLEDKQSYFN